MFTSFKFLNFNSVNKLEDAQNDQELMGVYGTGAIISICSKSRMECDIKNLLIKNLHLV